MYFFTFISYWHLVLSTTPSSPRSSSMNMPCPDAESGSNNPPTPLQSSEFEGFKWSLKAFREWLCNREGKEKCDRVWKQVDDIIIKTIIAAEPELTHSIYTCREPTL